MKRIWELYKEYANSLFQLFYGENELDDIGAVIFGVVILLLVYFYWALK